MAVLLQDDFNRANNTTSLGSPVVGGPYTVQSGTWGVISNEAYLSTVVAGGQVTFPAAVNLEISHKIPVATGSTVIPGLMFRWVDASNHWLMSRTGGGLWGLFRCIAGTYNQIGPSGTLATLTDVVMVRTFGNQIAAYVNGKQFVQFDDQWFGNGASIAGLRNGGTVSGRWDDLLVQDQTTPLHAGIADASVPPDDLIVANPPSNISSLYKGRDTATADESEIP